MSNSGLCKELSRKICKDLGCTPFSLKKTGITHPDLLLREPLKIIDENGLVKKISVWYGEASGVEGVMCCLLTALDDNPNTLEIACVIGFKNQFGELQEDAVRAGFRYDWASEDDVGTLIMRAGDKWLALSLAQKLQLALGFENMVQDGILWQQEPNVPKELKKNLSEIIEVDEKD